jgi:glycosyltransferase involved in cell wall biosynthesis
MVSIVISAYNEEKKIKECLESVKWADEIIFLDNSSTDKTAQIAKQYTKKIFTQKNDPLSIDLQKNLGIEKATGDWILVLDADERVTPQLAEEIKRVCTPNENANIKSNLSAYWIPRKNIIFGKWIEHTGWYPDAQLRLFRKGKGKFQQKHVHEPLHVDGATGHLTSPLLHENYETISQFLNKTITMYAPNEAEEKLRLGYRFDWKDAIRFPLKEFLSRFFAREGYKDGLHGLMLSLLMAVYHFSIFAYLWEKKDFPKAQYKADSFPREVNKELNKAQKELTYWLYNEKIKQEKNPLKKLLLKGERKLR